MNTQKLLAIAGLITLTLVGSAYAGEESTVSLTPHRAQMKTSTDYAILPHVTEVAGFSPTTVDCPSKTCTLRVEVASHFIGDGDDTDVHGIVVLVHVDGSTDGILPAYWGVFSGHAGFLVEPRTFTFMKEGLAKGNHTVNVSYSADLNAGSSDVFVAHRILTVQIFTP
jgi:hypothetical protein